MTLMLQQFLFSIRDIRKKKLVILLFVFEIVFVLIYFTITGGQAIYTRNMLKVMQGLNDYNIVYYQSYDNDMYSTGLHEFISDLLDENKAYTVLSGMGSQNDSPYNIVIVLGAFNEIFKLDDLYPNSYNDTVCLIGSDVKLNIGDKITVDLDNSSLVEVMARIPSNSYYVAGNSVRSFDDKIIISKDLETSKNLFYTFDFIQSTYLVNPSSELLNQYQMALEDAGMQASPRSLAQYADSTSGRQYAEYGLLSATLFFLVLVFVMITILINTLQIVDSNMREYSIHILYGANFGDVFLRTFFFVTAITIPPIIIYYSFLDMILIGKKLPLAVLVLFMVSISILICLFALRKLNKHDISDYSERGE